MASIRDVTRRLGIFSLAFFFILTSVGVSAVVIYQATQESKREASQKAAMDKLNSAQNPQEGQQAQPDQNNKPKEGALQGTKLKDFTPVAEPITALQKTDIVEGTGAEAKAGDTVTAHYTGAVVKDGTIFQSSLDRGEPFTSELAGLIKGWQDGIPGMKEGGTRRLVIPAVDAYGAKEQPGIPANSDLVFDIQLIKVGK